MKDYRFADVQAQYQEWASTRQYPARTTTTPAAQTDALRMMEDALAELEAQNADLRQELAKAAHDYARLLARTGYERRKRAAWRDAPLALAATVWDALVGPERDHLAGLLFCALGVVALCVAVFAGMGGAR